VIFRARSLDGSPDEGQPSSSLPLRRARCVLTLPDTPAALIEWIDELRLVTSIERETQMHP